MININPERRITVVLTKKQEGQEETFGFVCTSKTSTKMLRELGKMAADPELSFSWYDAALVGEKIRSQVSDATEPPAESPQGPKDPPAGFMKR